MANVILYEKRACGGNARKKPRLISSGHALEVRHVLAKSWTSESLRPFFGSWPVTDACRKEAPHLQWGRA